MEMEQSAFGKRHPLVILIYLLGAMIVTMWTMRIEMLFLSMCMAFWYALFLRGGKAILQTLAACVVVFLFLCVVMPFFRHAGTTPLFYINGSMVSLESVIWGLVMTLLIVAALLWFQVGNAWIDSEKMLYLFGRFFPSVGLMISQVFRMIPLMKKRYREIHEGQKGLGLAPSKKNFLARGRFFAKELSVLVSWSLEGSIETSMAMESRGYGVGHRTSFHLFRFRRMDALFLVIFCLLYGITIWCEATGAYDVSYVPCFEMKRLGWKGVAGLASFGLAAMLPFVVDLVKRRRTFL